MADPRYIGLPMADVAADLRLLAAKIADGVTERPTRALLIAYDADGVPSLHTFGAPYASAREGIETLLVAALSLNADAAN